MVGDGIRAKLANAGGSLTTYTHDAAGNRTAVLPSSGASSQYTWDASAWKGNAGVS